MVDLLKTANAGRYACIYADPPWTFVTHSDNGKDRSPEKHYDCMDISAIEAMPVSLVAARDAWLFLWTTWPHMPQALDVMRYWGFQYSGIGFLWAKTYGEPELDPRDQATPIIKPSDWVMSLGYTTRKNTEPCILGKRGSPQRLHKDVRELIVAPRREHSRKPDVTHARIRRFCPGPRLEMFARTSVPGFDAWGAEVGKFPAVNDSETISS